MPRLGRWLGQAEADSRYVNVAGDAMTGALAMGASKITDLAAPTDANDAVRKAYADLFAQLTGAAFTGAVGVTLSTTGPGLKVEQNGAAAAIVAQPDGSPGYAFEILDSAGAEVARIGHDGIGGCHIIWTTAGQNLKLVPGDAAGRIDARTALTNTSANHNGNVAIDALDDAEMLGNQKGLIVRTSTGARYRINISDAGVVQATAL